MPVSVTLTFDSLEEAITTLARVRNQETAPAPDKAAPPPKPSKEKAAAPASAPAAATPSTAKPPAAAPGPSSAPSVSSDREAMRDEINAGIVKDRAAVVKTLAAFGAKTGKDITDDKIDEFRAALAAALSSGEDLGG